MGKHKYIETPEKMWELFESYAQEVKETPRYKTEYVGKNGDMVRTPLERPLTMDGFEIYGFKKGVTLFHYFDNSNGAYVDYCAICTHIRKSIREDQISGGMVGQYNPSITQRLNGLTDKTENKNDNTHSGTIDITMDLT